MLDPLVSLAFNVQASPGVYALLLGSGLSRSAAIPTGWEVVQDLVRRYASLAGKDVGAGDPIEWYKAEFNAEPTYSGLLNELAGTPAERSRILRGYFEPSASEREEGLKSPTPAHQAIARLVSSGYVRVIITTNFDRLLEMALEAVGVVPNVISTEDQASGAIPLQHTKCTIVKVNGDYLDSRIRNTLEELSSYGAHLSSLLDRIFDEFGLIVCGWSSEWDPALRAALERRTNRRFTTYWTTRHELAEPVKQLNQRLGSTLIKIVDADKFFVDLAEKVEGITDLNSPHPLAPQIAVATLKRLLPDPAQEIRLDDLISAETEAVVSACSAPEFAPFGGVDGPTITRRVGRYEAIVTTMLHLLAAGVYFGKDLHDQLWIRALQHIARDKGEAAGLVVLIHLRGYPATLSLYAAGIAAIAAGRFDTFAAVLTKVIVRTNSEEVPFILTEGFTDRRFAKLLPGLEQRNTAMSDHLHKILREPLRRYLPDDEDYEKAFDRFEALTAVTFIYIRQDEWFPFGRFTWNRGRHGWTVRDELKDGAEKYWLSMKAGLSVAGGSNVRFFEAAKHVYAKGVML